MKTNTTLTAILAIVIFPMTVWAGDLQSEKKYQIGGRSAIISGKMKLSKINPAFDNLGANGTKGVHHSGLFFLYTVKPWLRVGFETLVGNTDENEKTTMNFQAAGPVADVSYGTKIFVAGGLHVGAMIANAMSRNGGASDTKVQTGTYFKSAGAFVAPYVGIGMHIKSYELRLFVKKIEVISTKDVDKIDAFSAPYYGVSYAVHF